MKAAERAVEQLGKVDATVSLSMELKDDIRAAHMARRLQNGIVQAVKDTEPTSILKAFDLRNIQLLAFAIKRLAARRVQRTAAFLMGDTEALPSESVIAEQLSDILPWTACPTKLDLAKLRLASALAYVDSIKILKSSSYGSASCRASPRARNAQTSCASWRNSPSSCCLT